ncbi:MAG: hypothetical protein P8Y45_12020, partial [Exilibacterium sp.]
VWANYPRMAAGSKAQIPRVIEKLPAGVTPKSSMSASYSCSCHRRIGNLPRTFSGLFSIGSTDVYSIPVAWQPNDKYLKKYNFYFKTKINGCAFLTLFTFGKPF